MGAAKLTVKTEKPKAVHTNEAADVLLDLEDHISETGPQRVPEQALPSRQRSAHASAGPRDELRKKRFSSILRSTRPQTGKFTGETPGRSSAPKRRSLRFRFSTTPETSAQRVYQQKTKMENYRSSPQSRLRTFSDSRESREGHITRRMRRSSSSQEALPRVSSLRRLSIPRSSSERMYGADVLRAAKVSSRSSSRRWLADDFAPPEQDEEGELDSFFRFMHECTRAAWVILMGIPAIVSQLPRITMDILKQLIPALRRPAGPPIEPPRDEKETS